MKSLEKNKGTVLAIIIFLAVMFGYRIFFKTEIADLYLDNTASSIGSNLVQTRMDLDSINFSQDIFSVSAFESLIDFSVVLVDQPIGRPNPFAAIGSN